MDRAARRLAGLPGREHGAARDDVRRRDRERLGLRVVPPHPSFFTFSGSWDASFYRTIAEHGYPTTLPTDGGGHVLPNPWAFLPVFPALVRAVMTVTGGSFWVAGVVVASLAGAGACVLLYRLVLAVGSSHRARWATALFTFGPTGFLLQVAYAESMVLLLLFGGLLALVRRRYGWSRCSGWSRRSRSPGSSRWRSRSRCTSSCGGSGRPAGRSRSPGASG